MLVTARYTLAVQPLSSANYSIPRSAQPGNGQGSLSSTNFKLHSTIGEIQSSTLTSTNFNSFAGIQNLKDIPRKVTSLTALTGFYPGEIELKWTTPGDDDDDQGQDDTVVLYKGARLYIATTTIEADALSTAYWNAHRNSAEIQISTSISKPNQGYLVTGLEEGVTYYFRMWLRNSHGNFTALSNGATNTAAIAEIGVVIMGTDTFNFGNMDLGASAVTGSSFTIRNVGNVKQDYSLSATTITTDSPWALDSAPGIDKAVLRGGFKASAPALVEFGAEDIIQFNDQISDSTKYAIGASSGTAAHIGQDRFLWLRLDTPLMTSTTWQQDIQINVTGNRTP